MQNDEARQLRELWAKKGNPICKHPHMDKEYYLGAQSGDYICDTCGEIFTEEDIKKLGSNLK